MEPILPRFRHIRMTVFQIDIREARSAAVQLSAAATAAGEGATVLARLTLSSAQVGNPDGDVVSQAVTRFAQRAVTRLEHSGTAVRTHSVNLRSACTGYTEVDEALARALRATATRAV